MSEADRIKWEQRYAEGAYLEREHPSEVLVRWVERLPRGRALDLACGAGRNALFLAAHGYAVDAVDIAPTALGRGRQAAMERKLSVNWIEQDLEENAALSPAPLPLAGEGNSVERGAVGGVYDVVVMIRFVSRGLLGALPGLLAPGGVAICEEHLATDDGSVIGPTNPAFRVAPGELRAQLGGLEVLEEFEGVIADPDGRRVALARLVARRLPGT